jgi:hypothetical protein
MKTKWALSWALALGSLSPQAMAWDCQTDCGRVAAFRYPCPTLRNPRRTCEGREPGTFAACTSAKVASCQIWEGAVDYAVPRIKPHMEGQFNAETWAAAQREGSPDAYMSQCIAAGSAVCAALGTELGGGPWGGVISGAVGVFVSARACEQSKSW